MNPRVLPTNDDLPSYTGGGHITPPNPIASASPQLNAHQLAESKVESKEEGWGKE